MGVVAREQDDGDDGDDKREEDAAHQSSKRSTMIWLRASPVSRKVAWVAAVMAGVRARRHRARRDPGRARAAAQGEGIAVRPGVVADHVVQLGAARRGEGVDVAQDHVVGVRRPIDHRQVAGLRGQLLEEGADRCDAHPARDERHARAPARGRGEATVGALGDDSREARSSRPRR